MAGNKPRAYARDAQWEKARKRYRLSAEHVRMAKVLGLNPAKLGKIANHRQERWKAPLPNFIEACYEDRFRARRRHPGESPSGQELPF